MHAAGPALYGHVVATNTFGEVYVIPANDTFENIKECLGAAVVTLPTVKDLAFGPSIGCKLRNKQVTERESKSISLQHSHSHGINKVLYAPKVWNPWFFKKRFVHNRTYMSTLEHSTSDQAILDAFLQDEIMFSTHWEVEIVRDYLKRSHQQPVGVHPHVYLVERSGDTKQRQAKWVRADEFPSHIKDPMRGKSDLGPDCNQRLV